MAVAFVQVLGPTWVKSLNAALSLTPVSDPSAHLVDSSSENTPNPALLSASTTAAVLH